MVRSIALALVLLAAAVGICHADEARVDEKWPSIIYYGNGLNSALTERCSGKVRQARWQNSGNGRVPQATAQ